MMSQYEYRSVQKACGLRTVQVWRSWLLVRGGDGENLALMCERYWDIGVFSGWEGVHSGVGVGVGVGLEEDGDLEGDDDSGGGGEIEVDVEVDVERGPAFFFFASSSRYVGEQYSRGRPRALNAIVG
jgi:hypothetical protein